MKRGRDELEEEEDKLFLAKALEEYKEQRRIKREKMFHSSTEGRIVKKLSDLDVAEQIGKIIPQIDNGEIVPIIVSDFVKEFSFGVRYPNKLCLAELDRLFNIEAIMRVELDIKEKGLMIVTLSQSYDSAVRCTYAEQDSDLIDQILKRNKERPVAEIKDINLNTATLKTISLLNQVKSFIDTESDHPNDLELDESTVNQKIKKVKASTLIKAPVQGHIISKVKGGLIQDMEFMASNKAAKLKMAFYFIRNLVQEASM